MRQGRVNMSLLRLFKVRLHHWQYQDMKLRELRSLLAGAGGNHTKQMTQSLLKQSLHCLVFRARPKQRMILSPLQIRLAFTMTVKRMAHLPTRLILDTVLMIDLSSDIACLSFKSIPGTRPWN